MDITFYGAAREVTGSCYLVKGEKTTVLVDCGLFQGAKFAHEKNYRPLPFACDEIDHILITHAHLDHTGRLPKVCMEGFNGNIYATKPTLELTRYLWEDALEVMNIDYEETGRLPLYSEGQVKKAMKFFTGIEYGEKIFLSDTDYAIFHDAGHILGSAFIELVVDGKRAVFSGDIGNVNPPIIRETETLPANIDTLIVESTYGNRIHEPGRTRLTKLLRAVKKTIKNKGVLLIPAFAVERTQEILHLFDELVDHQQIPPVPIFLDAPLAIKATNVFRKYPKFYNQREFAEYSAGDDIFDFPGLTLSRTRRMSKKINSVPGPKIIIAGSGMMNGGRILYHLMRYLPDPNTTLLIIGYQARQTLGRKIFEGAKSVRIYRKTIPVRAHIEAIGGYSAHADQRKLLSWIGLAKKLKKVFLVHGDEKAMTAFQQVLKTRKISAAIPKSMETVKL